MIKKTETRVLRYQILRGVYPEIPHGARPEQILRGACPEQILHFVQDDRRRTQNDMRRAQNDMKLALSEVEGGSE
jgi:hypothetical protein